jgi:FMN-dependent oxidoreductase (nitrilotriacetate monooxygenase family)
MNDIQLTTNSALRPEVGVASEVLLGVLLLALVCYVKVKLVRNTKDFVIANRKVGFGFGVAGLISIWTWAMAVMMSAAQTYSFGLSGLFWFTVPNGLAVIAAIPFVRKIRTLMRSGRYERMEEYMELCYKLWDSWAPDAIVANRATGIFADPARVHEVSHAGEFFRCKARSFVYRSPQGRPVLWQAGSSDRGRDFAAKHAGAIFAVHPNVERMREYTDDLNIRLEKRFGRPRDGVKRIYGIQTVVGLTRSEAQEKYERIQQCIPPEGAMAWISGHFGPDFSKYDPDEIVQNIEIPGIQGLFDSIIYAKGGAPVTVREASLIYAEGMGMPRLVGTAADIVDQLEHFMDEGGADGFMLAATYTPGCFEEFVDLVVPELQGRGRFRTEYSGSTLRENLLDY